MQLCNTHSLEATHFSLLEFSKLDFELPESDYLFFYSKSGVRYFFEYYNQLKADRKYKVICFGPETAKYCKQFMEVSFHGDGTPGKALKIIKDNLGDHSIAFVCGRRSLRSVHKFMEEPRIQECVVYDSNPKRDIVLGKFDLAILTSPLNAISFINNGGRALHYISIGSTTAKQFEQLNISSLQSKVPSESGLADSLRLLLEN